MFRVNQEVSTINRYLKIILKNKEENYILENKVVSSTLVIKLLTPIEK